MPGLSMTFKVNLDRGISHQVTHLNGTDSAGITLYICEFNDNDEQIKSQKTITVDEFKRNNISMFKNMLSRQQQGETM